MSPKKKFFKDFTVFLSSKYCLLISFWFYYHKCYFTLLFSPQGFYASMTLHAKVHLPRMFSTHCLN